MANKTLRTRQKPVFRATLAARRQKSRNPVAQTARERAAGPHRPNAYSQRRGQRRALKKILAGAGDD